MQKHSRVYGELRKREREKRNERLWTLVVMLLLAAFTLLMMVSLKDVMHAYSIA